MFHSIRNKNIFHNSFWILMFISLLWTIGNSIIEFVFPTYLQSIGIPFWQIGILLSIVSISGMLIDMPIGNVSDQYSRKNIMFAGLVMSPIFVYCIFSYTQISILIFFFLLWGMAFQIWKVPRDVYLAALTKKGKRSESLGIDLEFSNLGYFIGPLIGGILLSYFGIISTIIFYTTTCILAAIMVITLLKTQIHNKKTGIAIEQEMTFKNTYYKDFKYIKLLGSNTLLLFIFSTLFTTWIGALWTLVPLFYSISGFNPAYGGMLISFFYLPSIFLGFPFGKLADKIGKTKILAAGLIVTSIGLITFSQTFSLSGLIISALIISIGTIMATPSLNGLIIDKSYNHTKGEITGIWDFFMDLGFIIGPITAGFLAEFYGIRYAFMCFGALFLISTILVLFIKEEK
ncbi:MAG: MFS transporter [DPANN group archaeon]|nr:MFS transporter [DPANN group archaeon]